MEPMADARSPQALGLGGLLDAHHPATEQVEPPLTGTCARCDTLMAPSYGGLKHLPAEGEFSRVRKWLEDNQ